MKIFEVIDDVHTLYMTRSESKAAYWLEQAGQHGWITETELDVFINGDNPKRQRIWNSVEEFKKEYGL